MSGNLQAYSTAVNPYPAKAHDVMAILMDAHPGRLLRVMVVWQPPPLQSRLRLHNLLRLGRAKLHPKSNAYRVLINLGRGGCSRADAARVIRPDTAWATCRARRGC